MIREFLLKINQPWLPTLGTALFVGIFVGMLIWINRRGSNSYYEEASFLPLDEGVKSER